MIKNITVKYRIFEEINSLLEHRYYPQVNIKINEDKNDDWTNLSGYRKSYDEAFNVIKSNHIIETKIHEIEL